MYQLLTAKSLQARDATFCVEYAAISGDFCREIISDQL